MPGRKKAALLMAKRCGCLAKKDLHQGEIQLFDLLYAGVSGVAGTAGVVISALRQEVHILRLYNVFQIGGDTHILGQRLTASTAAARAWSRVISSTPLTPMALAISRYFSPVAGAL